MPGRERPARTLPKLKRKAETVDLPLRLVFVCEGKTEKRLLDDLRQHWRIACATVEIIGQAGDPGAVVERASALRAKDTTVWAMFDRDEHTRWALAVDRARACGVKLALSNPCIELYGILLHTHHAAWIHRHDAQRALRELHPGYHHENNPVLQVNVVLDSLDAARNRAEALDAAAARAGDPLGNPTTAVPRAIDALRAFAR